MANFDATYRGLVVRTNDPTASARIILQIPQVLGTAESAWARPSAFTSTTPNVGDTVYVTFEGGDVSQPVYTPLATQASAAPIPKPPTGVILDPHNTMTSEGVTLTDVTISWTPPTENQDGSVPVSLSGYLLYITTDNTTWASGVYVDSNLYVARGLMPGRTYYFRVASVNEMLQKSASYASGNVALAAATPPAGTTLGDQATAITNLQTSVSTQQGQLDGKAVVWVQDTAPSGLGTADKGDIWINTSTANRVTKVWDGSAWQDITDQKTLDTLGQVQGKITTFYAVSTATPTATALGDLWIVTDDSNRIKRWTGSDMASASWQYIDDQRVALKAQTFYNALASIPVAKAIGDLWIPSDAPNAMYRAAAAGANTIAAGAWVLITQSTPRVVANGATSKTFYSPVGFSSMTSSLTDNIVIETPITFTNVFFRIKVAGYNFSGTANTLDMDLGGYAYSTGPAINSPRANNAGNFPVTVRYARNATTNTLAIVLNGSFSYPKLQVTEAQIGYNALPPDSWLSGWSASVVTEANFTANYNLITAVTTDNALATANAAASSANGKNKVTYSTGVPGSTANSAGDIWFQYVTGGTIIAQWTGQGGTTWQANTLRDEVIASVNAGKILTGTLQATTTVTVGTVGGARVDIAGGGSTPGITAYNSSGSQTFRLDSTTGSASFMGSILSGSTITGASFKTAASGARWELNGGALVRVLQGYTGRSDESSAAFLSADSAGTMSIVGASFTGQPTVPQLVVGPLFNSGSTAVDGGKVDTYARTSGTYLTAKVGQAGPQPTRTTSVILNNSAGTTQVSNILREDYAAPSGASSYSQTTIQADTGYWQVLAQLMTSPGPYDSSSLYLSKDYFAASAGAGTWQMKLDKTAGLTVSSNVGTGSVATPLTVNSSGVTVAAALNDANDTGWVTCTLKAGFAWQGTGGAEAIQVRKKFGIIYIRGAVSSTGIVLSSSNTVATMPSWAWPPKNVVNQCGTSAGAASAVAFVTTGGDLQVRTNNVASSYYFFGGFTWPVD